MENVMALILAAGEGKRMESKYSKVIHPACGKPVIKWVCDAADGAKMTKKVVVIGHRADQVKNTLGEDYEYVYQHEQLGTGHAVMQAGEILKNTEGLVFILYGDVPLVTADTLKRAVKFHKKEGNKVTVLTARVNDPTGYGRIVRDEKGNIERIVEQRDATEEILRIDEINSGMYCFSIKPLLYALDKLKNDNVQGEYYLTDTLEILIKAGHKAGAFIVDKPEEILGVNDRIQLYNISSYLRKRINERHMRAGVTILDPDTTFIGEDVLIGADTTIYPGTTLEGSTVIGSDCVIGPGTTVSGCLIGNFVVIKNSVLTGSEIGNNCTIGPFTYIRPGSRIFDNVKVGSFVEVKNSAIGKETKIPHLSYIGDSIVGENVNVGCGTITVNFDGKKKNTTFIRDRAFIGCNSNLVAPVCIGEDSYIAAGSTITEDVPAHSLAIARQRQVNKEDWVKKRP